MSVATNPTARITNSWATNWPVVAALFQSFGNSFGQQRESLDGSQAAGEEWSQLKAWAPGRKRKSTARLLMLAFVLSMPVVAMAQTPAPAASAPAAAPLASPSADDLAKAKEAFTAGKALYDAKKYPEASEQFKQSYRLSRNPLLLYYVGLSLEQEGDRDRAIFYQKKFLAEAPASAATQRADAEARLKKMEEAVAMAAAAPTTSGTPTTAPEATKTPEKTKTPAVPTASTGDIESGFTHELVEELPPAQPVDFEVTTQPDVTWTIKVFVRPAGSSNFKASTFERMGAGIWRARVGAAMVRGSSIQYYIEARDKSDNVIARNGSVSSPNIVSVVKGAPTRYVGSATKQDLSTKAGNDDAGGDISGKIFYQPGHKSFKKGKWISTGVGAGGLVLGATFAFVASDQATKLEGYAALSRGSACAEGPPCLQYDDTHKKFQSRGETFEKLSKISFGLGIAGAAVATYYWIAESGSNKKHQEQRTVFVPFTSGDGVGAAAIVRF